MTARSRFSDPPMRVIEHPAVDQLFVRRDEVVTQHADGGLRTNILRHGESCYDRHVYLPVRSEMETTWK
jgi:hypothetical protein